MLDRLRSPAAGRLMVWVAALVLLAGVVAFVTVRLGSGGAATPVVADGTETDTSPTTTTPPEVSDVPKAARVAAGQFILAAVGREDLAKAWKLTHPDLKQQCGCTYKQWLTGNIPVQPFPTAGLEGVSFFVDELAPRRVVLQTLLRPKLGREIGNQAFYIGLKAVGSGKSLRWLVDYWAPIGSPPVPLDPGTG
jgi:hypothetical protein